MVSGWFHTESSAESKESEILGSWTVDAGTHTETERIKVTVAGNQWMTALRGYLSRGKSNLHSLSISEKRGVFPLTSYPSWTPLRSYDPRGPYDPRGTIRNKKKRKNPSDDAGICGTCAVGQRSREHAGKVVGTRGSGSCTSMSRSLSPSPRRRSNCGRIPCTKNYDHTASAPTVSHFSPKTRVGIFLARRHVGRNQKPYTNVRRLIISTSNRYTYAFDSDPTSHMHTRHRQKPDMDQVEIHNLTAPIHLLATLKLRRFSHVQSTVQR